MNRVSVRTTISLLAALCLCCAMSSAQSASGSSPKSGSPSSSGQSSAAETAANSPFSIETEMFTYKAVEENSQVIACDIARYLFQSDVTEAPAGSHSPCLVSNPSQSNPGIVIVSPDSTLISDFQLWRADMATMSALESRADAVCVASETKSENGQENPAEPHIEIERPHRRRRWWAGRHGCGTGETYAAGPGRRRHPGNVQQQSDGHVCRRYRAESGAAQ